MLLTISNILTAYVSNFKYLYKLPAIIYPNPSMRLLIEAAISIV